MNPYIEFTQWLIATVKAWWKEHGTKITGWLLMALGTLQIMLEGLTADPEVKLLITPKQFAYMHLINIVLAAIVIRRGFTNSKTGD